MMGGVDRCAAPEANHVRNRRHVYPMMGGVDRCASGARRTLPGAPRR